MDARRVGLAAAAKPRQLLPAAAAAVLVRVPEILRFQLLPAVL
jgi:hypothetical protein